MTSKEPKWIPNLSFKKIQLDGHLPQQDYSKTETTHRSKLGPTFLEDMTGNRTRA